MPIYTSHVSASTAVTASLYKVDTSLVPDANDGASIGAATTAFSDLFLAEGGVINWDNGDATLTQAGNVVTLAGATFAGTLSTAAQPNITSLGVLPTITIGDGGEETYFEVSTTQRIIDYMVIGGNTPAAGTFTDLTSTGNTTIGNASGDSLTINAQSITAPNMTSGTSNSVLVKGSIGAGSPIYTDEIDPRVWGSTLLDGSNGTNNEIAIFTDDNSVEGDSKVTWDGATFAIDGDLRAINYIVSSSITHMTQSFSSGSTIFGDTLDDRHEFTGSLFTKGTGSFDNGINATVLTAAQGNITSLGTLNSLVVNDGGTPLANQISIDGSSQGTIDNVSIGGNIAAAGAFTTLSSTGNTTIGDASGDTLTINAENIDAVNMPATDAVNSVVVRSGSGLLFTDEIDPKVWGSSGQFEIIDGSGGANQLAYFSAARTIASDGAMTFDGNNFSIDGGVIAGGNVSSSYNSTGSFGMVKATKLVGDGSGITGLSSAAIASAAGMTNNYILTATGDDSVTGESNLTFDGNQLTIAPGGSGEISLNGQLGGIEATSISNSGTISTQHITATGNISGSATSTGSFGLLMGDGSEITGLPTPAIYSTSGMTNNYVLTATGDDSVTGEASLQFNGNLLTVDGMITGSGNIDVPSISGSNFTLISGSANSTASFTMVSASRFVGEIETAAQPNITSLGTLNQKTEFDQGIEVRVGNSTPLVLDSTTQTMTGVSIGSITNRAAALFSTVEATGLTSTGNIVSTAANGKISGSSTSTGSFGLLKGDGSALTGISSYADLDFTTDGAETGLKITDGESLVVAGGNGISTSGAVNTITIAAAEADTTTQGIVELATSAETITGTDTIRAVTPDGLNARIAEGANGKISGSATSTGSFGRVEATKLVGDGSGITGLTSAAISQVFGETDNYVLTSGGSGVAVGESALQFDGNLLTVDGMITGSGNIDVPSISGSSLTLVSGSANSTASFTMVSASSLIGEIETAAQPNITSFGTLSTLNVGTVNSILGLGGVENTMNGVTIGGTTAAAATFTTINVTSNATIGNSGDPGIHTINGSLQGNLLSKVSGSATSTGSFAKLIGDGSEITGLSSAAIASAAGMTNNYILTATGADSVTGESGLTFNANNQVLAQTNTAGGVEIHGSAGLKVISGNVSGSAVSTGSFGHIYTAGGGVTAGTILPDADNAYDLGSASYRFANLYVGDLMMSNKSRGGNEVDGTYGDYTIQEGEEDLYLLNHRNGKTYRFKLEEVDSRPWYKKIFS